jgi:hypothetical protein
MNLSKPVYRRRLMKALDLDPASDSDRLLLITRSIPSNSGSVIGSAGGLVSNKSIWQPADDQPDAKGPSTLSGKSRGLTLAGARDSSETKIGLGRGFEAERDPGVDQDDRLARLRQCLVEQTLGIPERACERVIRHYSATYLIRNKNHRTS